MDIRLSSLVLWTVILPLADVHNVETFECELSTNCTCYGGYVNTADCRFRNLEVVPDGLELADSFVFSNNLFNTSVVDFKLSWISLLNAIDGVDVRIVLDTNPLMGLPKWFLDKQLRNLLRLDLSRCQISELTKTTFSELVSLRTLLLTGNLIGSLPDGVFNNQIFLHTLVMECCDLGRIDKDIFVPLNKLLVLYLSGNKLEALPGGIFRNQIKLYRLDLTYCQITAFEEDVFLPLVNLEELFLIGNPVSVLPVDLFINQAALTNLDIGMCKIDHLDEDVFVNLGNLKQLSFDGNKIKALPVNLLRNQHLLQHLNIANNELTDFQEGILKPGHYDTIKSLYTFGNPFVCGCGILGLKSFASNTVPPGVYIYPGTCAVPDDSKNQVPVLDSDFSQCDNDVIQTTNNINTNINNVFTQLSIGIVNGDNIINSYETKESTINDIEVTTDNVIVPTVRPDDEIQTTSKHSTTNTNAMTTEGLIATGTMMVAGLALGGVSVYTLAKRIAD